MCVWSCRLKTMQIVILSLVRNSGGDDDDLEVPTISQHTRVNIGFLKVRGEIRSTNVSADLVIPLSSLKIVPTVGHYMFPSAY